MKPRQTLSAILLVMGSLFYSPAYADQSLERYLSNGELQNFIERWSKAQSAYYSVLYDAQLIVTVADERRLVSTFLSYRLPDELPSADRDIVRLVVLRSLDSVLSRAFTEAVRGQYASIDGLIETLVLKKGAKVEVTDKNVDIGLREADCHIIPCDPKLCKVTGCGDSAFQRFRKK